MTKKIEKLIKAYDKVKANSNKDLANHQNAIQGEYDKVFKRDKELQKALTALESGGEYGSNENGIYRYIRFYGLSDIDENAREYLESYVDDNYCAYVNWENDCLYTYEGGSFIINDDGDVYDSDSSKFFISKKDYEDETERNELIEKHMEKTGYYPGVFSMDRHGNVFHVSTVQK